MGWGKGGGKRRWPARVKEQGTRGATGAHPCGDSGKQYNVHTKACSHVSVLGWITSPKKCWSPNPLDLTLWSYLGIASLQTELITWRCGPMRTERAIHIIEQVSFQEDDGKTLGRTPCADGAEMRVTQLNTKDCQQPRFLVRVSERAWSSWQHLDLELLASRTVKEYISAVLRPPVYCILLRKFLGHSLRIWAPDPPPSVSG